MVDVPGRTRLSHGDAVRVRVQDRIRRRVIDTTISIPPVFLYSITMSSGLTIVQSSASQSALPVVREFVSNSKDKILLFSFLYPPELFAARQGNLTVFDWTDRIPGYSDKPLDLLENIPSSKSSVLWCF